MAQHLEALEKANRTRFARAEIKKKVDCGELDIRELIVSPPAELETMPVYDLVISQHRWGRFRALKLIGKIGFSEFMTVGSLTPRQATELAEMLS